MAKKDIFTETQQQLNDLYRKSQDAVIAGIETSARATRELFNASALQVDPKDVESSIDQAFTAVTSAVDEQRAFVKRLFAAATVTDES